MASEQDEFNRLASRAIHTMGLLGARLGLDPDNPDGRNNARIENAFAVMAKRLPVAEAELKKATDDLQLERHANTNLKVTISTLRDRVKLFREAIMRLSDTQPGDAAGNVLRVACENLLAIHDVP